MYIKTGKGSKRILRNWFITNVFEDMKPHLRDNNVNKVSIFYFIMF